MLELSKDNSHYPAISGRPKRRCLNVYLKQPVFSSYSNFGTARNSQIIFQFCKKGYLLSHCRKAGKFTKKHCSFNLSSQTGEDKHIKLFMIQTSAFTLVSLYIYYSHIYVWRAKKVLCFVQHWLTCRRCFMLKTTRKVK